MDAIWDIIQPWIIHHKPSFPIILPLLYYPSLSLPTGVKPGSWPVVHGLTPRAFPLPIHEARAPGLALDGSVGGMGTTMDVGRSQRAIRWAGNQDVDRLPKQD